MPQFKDDKMNIIERDIDTTSYIFIITLKYIFSMQINDICVLIEKIKENKKNNRNIVLRFNESLEEAACYMDNLFYLY